MRRTRWTGALAAGAAGALLLAACSGGSEDTGSEDSGSESGESTESSEESGSQDSGELTPVSLQLQWLTQAQFAGYFAALDQGYYEEEGIDLEIIESGGDIVPQDALAAGEVDFAIAWVPKVLGSIEQGAGITNIAQIFERSGTLQVAFADSGITGVEDLEGASIGSWGYGNEWELFAGLNQAGVEDFEMVTQAFDMLALLNGDIDAAQAMTYNEYAQLLETVNPDTGELYTAEDFVVIDWNEEGVAMLQDAVWADTERLETDEAYADLAVRFLKATVKGWIYARDNPEETATIVTEAGSTLGESHQLWMTNETNKLVWPSTTGGIGLVDQEVWDRTVDLALGTSNETGATIISTEPPESALSTTYIEQALAELEAEGYDVVGESFAPIEVTLNEGGA
ncbi:ABC transporter substrate-binding protein [Serinibacter salmoneus]|uniref:Thiamine pyrimidine synthase n=1 Tax=Serinibacter salmoneus TaxID=556530 RepID=A0A2A9D097_9MICO|nr:ABC transporter substrate-binding protein [Serinibacter salmoneus]PFG19270.1 NitT/TauT family transport system substrate-binding protein [Serinibacter salmoneus]